MGGLQPPCPQPFHFSTNRHAQLTKPKCYTPARELSPQQCTGHCHSPGTCLHNSHGGGIWVLCFSTGEGKRADTARDTCRCARHPLHHGRRSEYSTPLKSKSFHCKTKQDPTCKPGGHKPPRGAPREPPAGCGGSRGPETPPWPVRRSLRAGEGNKAPTRQSAA